ncbi:uncharacterized protein LOC111875642 isoform X1 [Cryptotermes secundus]|uniref:uncharacterized protein LOC111875642 isoform X1 n=1 Tax=Cryptotermes secundus TaxID=105785 RepID=UPI000CD7C803|nr:uncharacterized protein LOC111875642 isoform X1 [Cryptotermes secundus]XP_033606050.1 uncharacterized protein LOC111875642 isoform X1 [Cryptotermes secundus]
MKVSPRPAEGGAVPGVVRVPKHSHHRGGRQLTRRSVTKMLAVMTEQSPDSSKDPVEAFLSTGRTGRRNALADIRGEHAATSTSSLPECLEKLSTNDKSSDNCDTQGSPTNSISGSSSSSGVKSAESVPLHQSEKGAGGIEQS